MAYDGDGEYLPGEWCTFCKVSVKCRARAEEKMKLARLEFKMPPLLTDAEIALKRYILVKEILNKSILRQEYVKFLILMRIIL